MSLLLASVASSLLAAIPLVLLLWLLTMSHAAALVQLTSTRPPTA